LWGSGRSKGISRDRLTLFALATQRMPFPGLGASAKTGLMGKLGKESKVTAALEGGFIRNF